MNFHVVNLGCKVNQVESESISNQLIELGYVLGTKADSQIKVVNTCTVTAKADNKSLFQIKRAIKDTKTKYLFVTGCLSEMDSTLKDQFPELTAIIPHKDKNIAGQYINNYIKDSHKSENSNEDINIPQGSLGKMHKIQESTLDTLQHSFIEHTRPIIKIQDGCNRFCTFCVIPYSRGVPVSRKASSIYEQIKLMVEKEVPEIVITGVNIGDYNDNGLNFEILLKNILDISNKTLIRISTLEPHSITTSFIELLGHPNISPHLHLALQSGSNKILKLMKRQYLREEFLDKINSIYKINNNFAIASDIIVGFPSEEEEDFQFSYDMVTEAKMMKVHVFPFSQRPFTKALDLNKKVDNKTIKDRRDRLITLSDKRSALYLKQMNAVKQRFILEEELNQKNIPLDLEFDKNKFYYRGTTEYYIKGIISLEKKHKRGQLLEVVSHSNKNQTLFNLA